MPALLAQLVPPLTDQQLFIALGVLVAVLLLLVVLLRKKKPAPAAEAKAETPALPAEPVVPKVTLAPSELEAAKRAEEDAARAAAQEAVRQRLALEREAKEAGAKADAAAVEALRAQEEEAKKAAYRAQKAAEAEAKDRKAQEKVEQAKAEAEAKARAVAEAEARAAALKAEEAKRAQAQSGQTLAAGLAKTKNEGFIAKLNGLFGGGPKVIDEQVLGDLEETLFTADIGVKTAQSLVELARDKAKKNELSSADGLKAVIRKEVERIVDLPAPKKLQGGGPPHVVMVVGVNGSGKTTTIGKLAAKAVGEGKKVLLAAGDTFRAAAAEQLDVWAERAGATLVKGKDDGDPAAVVFDAVKRAKAEGFDLVIADTAGRLHTAAPLMEELKKVKRVVDKALPGAPHEVLLVLDSTNGQNAIHQARQFHDAVGLTSIALTKLDGTAKGGVIIGICDELKVPVSWAGVGEQVADLRPFEPKEFVSALFD